MWYEQRKQKQSLAQRTYNPVIRQDKIRDTDKCRREYQETIRQYRLVRLAVVSEHQGSVVKLLVSITAKVNLKGGFERR